MTQKKKKKRLFSLKARFELAGEWLCHCHPIAWLGVKGEISSISSKTNISSKKIGRDHPMGTFSSLFFTFLTEKAFKKVEKEREREKEKKRERKKRERERESKER